jgi:hypothetical protein
MKGVRAQELLDYLIEALHEYLPAGVRAVRTRVGVAGGLQIWAVPSKAPADVDYGFWDIRSEPTSGHVEQRGPWAPWGFGSWAPLPRRLRMRIDAVAALEIIQEAVQRVDPNWPAPDAKVKARPEHDQVLVWFHKPSGGSLPPPVRLPNAVFR